MTKPKSKRAEFFSQPVAGDLVFVIVPPLPITRDVSLAERLAAFKAMKRKIRDLGRR